jgi:acyl-coenzyme A synthetase/AMP-(fatty) acid ligase
LASYKMPREIRFDIPLPREDSGKVKKRLLRDQWLSQIAGLAGKT